MRKREERAQARGRERGTEGGTGESTPWSSLSSREANDVLTKVKQSQPLLLFINDNTLLRGYSTRKDIYYRH